MKLAWATDIHLNFVGTDRAARFCREAAEADALLLGGDIGESDDVAGWLQFIEGRLERPVYFVLGNHDYYGASIGELNEAIARAARESTHLRWLSLEEPVALTPRAGLVGHDGWGDARFGNFARSPVLLNDFFRIRELTGLDREDLGATLRALGDAAAARVRQVLPKALDRFEELIFLTHVPPFLEACWHEGRISDDDWSPFFTCKAVGDVLREAMAARPDRRMTVLCGHTHGSGEARILPNLLVRTGGADYGDPRVQRPLIEV